MYNKREFIYTWGLIDANYILFREKAILAKDFGDQPIPKNRLFSAVIQAFMRLKGDVACIYPLFVWDKSPYHKLQTLQTYKADRWYPTDEEYDALELEKVSATPERLVEITAQQNKIRREQANMDAAQYVKYRIINEMGDMGFHSLIKPGYEADDLAFLASCLIASYHKHDDRYSAILVTADKDWTNFQLPGVEFISTYNWSPYTNLTEEYEDAREKICAFSEQLYHEPCIVSRYQYGILEELMHKSHNNACVWSHRGVNRQEAIAKLMHGDTSLVDYQPLHDAYCAMNMLEGVIPNTNTRYVDDTREDIINAINPANFTYKQGRFNAYCFEKGIDTGFENYMDFVEGMHDI